MMFKARDRILLQRVTAAVAIAFGLLTIFAGGRVLVAGVDPGYLVFRPLLVFNTVMGVAYAVVGVAIWRTWPWSVRGAGTILALNITVLASIVALYATGGGVATDSLRAMAFRCAVWLALFGGARLAIAARPSTHTHGRSA